MKRKKRTNLDLEEQMRLLYEWADDRLFSDEVLAFISFCRRNGYEETEILSSSEFDELYKEYKSENPSSFWKAVPKQVLSLVKGWYGLPYQLFCLKIHILSKILHQNYLTLSIILNFALLAALFASTSL